MTAKRIKVYRATINDPKVGTLVTRAAGGRVIKASIGTTVVDGAMYFTVPPRGKAGAREQLKAAVSANKHILDELAKY